MIGFAFGRYLLFFPLLARLEVLGPSLETTPSAIRNQKIVGQDGQIFVDSKICGSLSYKEVRRNSLKRKWLDRLVKDDAGERDRILDFC